MKIMGLDFGTKTVGVAISDESELIAQPYDTIVRARITKLRQTHAAIERIISELGVGKVVIGLPMNMNGTEGERAEATRDFAANVARRTGLPVELWDERLTTVEADRILEETGVAISARKEHIDKMAAAIILQNYLDCQKNGVENPQKVTEAAEEIAEKIAAETAAEEASEEPATQAEEAPVLIDYPAETGIRTLAEAEAEAEEEERIRAAREAKALAAAHAAEAAREAEEEAAEEDAAETTDAVAAASEETEATDAVEAVSEESVAEVSEETAEETDNSYTDEYYMDDIDAADPDAIKKAVLYIGSRPVEV